MSLRPLKALLFKYGTLWIRSGFRAADFLFYPMVDLAIWSLVTTYMLKVSNAVPSTIIFLVSAIIFWNVLFRAQQVVCISFLDDVWCRNLLNMFTAPISTVEYIVACYLIGLAQALCILLLQVLLIYFTYSYNVFGIGLYAVIFFLNLLFTGWSIGLFTTGLIVRFGQSAETLAWLCHFLFSRFRLSFSSICIT